MLDLFSELTTNRFQSNFHISKTAVSLHNIYKKSSIKINQSFSVTKFLNANSEMICKYPRFADKLIIVFS